MSEPVRKLLFLPGASGNQAFWRPVAARLGHPAARSFMGWPGFGGLPADPTVNGIDDLVARVVREIDQPVDLLAQSMGGVIALRAALQRPQWVRHLVLATTSGGIDVKSLGGSDWRQDYVRNLPNVPAWFISMPSDLSARLPSLTMPCLLLFGDADPISPVAVGERLRELLPNAELVVVPGGDHDLVHDRAEEVAPHIERHLQS